MGPRRDIPAPRRAPDGTAAAVLLAVAMLSAPHASGQEPGALPAPLVYLRDIDATILQDIRYAGSDNFIGRPVPGYGAPECVLLREAAEALSRVQRVLLARNLSLKVYDCYRPRQAVRAFVGFVKDGADAAHDPRLKRFHPNVERSRLIESGYVAAVSQHSRGDTVDITLVELPARPMAPFSRRAVYGACTGPAEARAPDSSVDMGTGYDCFDPLSHTNAVDITPAQRLWRQVLVDAMAGEGFRNYTKEWWHFTLSRTRSARSFDVPIMPRRQP